MRIAMFRVVVSVVATFVLVGFAAAQSTIPDTQRISPEELTKVLSGSGPKPLILQVGPQRLYRTAHIRGAEYAGPASQPDGLQSLRNRVRDLSRKTSIVIYCGCCPWTHCPNVEPAYAELTKLGFKNVKVLYLPNNFKTDWHDKGYPTDVGQ